MLDASNDSAVEQDDTRKHVHADDDGLCNTTENPNHTLGSSTLLQMRNDTRPPGVDERYHASMVLAAVGDAMGYRKGDWEFCASTSKILQDLHKLTDGKGVIALDCSHWMV